MRLVGHDKQHVGGLEVLALSVIVNRRILIRVGLESLGSDTSDDVRRLPHIMVLSLTWR